MLILLIHQFYVKSFVNIVLNLAFNLQFYHYYAIRYPNLGRHVIVLFIRNIFWLFCFLVIGNIDLNCRLTLLGHSTCSFQRLLRCLFRRVCARIICCGGLNLSLRCRLLLDFHCGLFSTLLLVRRLTVFCSHRVRLLAFLEQVAIFFHLCLRDPKWVHRMLCWDWRCDFDV